MISRLEQHLACTGNEYNALSFPIKLRWHHRWYFVPVRFQCDQYLIVFASKRENRPFRYIKHESDLISMVSHSNFLEQVVVRTYHRSSKSGRHGRNIDD